MTEDRRALTTILAMLLCGNTIVSDKEILGVMKDTHNIKNIITPESKLMNEQPYGNATQ